MNLGGKEFVWRAMPGAAPQGRPKGQPPEASALDKIMWFGAIQLVGMAFSWILGYYVLGAMFPSIAGIRQTPNPTPADVAAALTPLFRTVGALVPVAAVIQLASLAVLTLAFRELVKVDRDRFSIPSIFMIILMAGAASAAVVFIPFINFIPGLIAQIPAGRVAGVPSAFAPALASLFLYIALLLIGGGVAVVGAVGGLILGLWRVGARYDETIIKIGAIFTVIPVLNIAAPILVLVGAHLARGRLV